MKKLYCCSVAAALLLGGCATPYSAVVKLKETVSSPAPTSSADGKYYLDDGPPDEAAAEKLAAATDAVPIVEKINPARNRTYTALGKTYHPYKQLTPYSKRGRASWYGKRYHGRKTASGEVYDMFKMTAAHPILPIPSYARVTHVQSGKTVVVRINDRGPFLQERVIDLSFAAAHRLGIVAAGTGEVIVEAIVPGGAESVIPQTESPAGEVVASAAAELPQQVYIQLGAFAERTNAEKIRQQLAAAGLSFSDKIYQRDDLHLFLIGPYLNEQAARKDDGVLCAADFCGFLTRAP